MILSTSAPLVGTAITRATISARRACVVVLILASLAITIAIVHIGVTNVTTIIANEIWRSGWLWSGCWNWCWTCTHPQKLVGVPILQVRDGSHLGILVQALQHRRASQGTVLLEQQSNTAADMRARHTGAGERA